MNHPPVVDIMPSHQRQIAPDDLSRTTISRSKAATPESRTNVYELDAASRPRAGWCFVPKDNLVAGDVMLAQKIALETDERGALAVANNFTPSPHDSTFRGAIIQCVAPDEGRVLIPTQDDLRWSCVEPPLLDFGGIVALAQFCCTGRNGIE